MRSASAGGDGPARWCAGWPVPYSAIGDAAGARPVGGIASVAWGAARTEAPWVSGVVDGSAATVTTRWQSLDSIAGAPETRDASATHPQWAPASGPIAVQ